MTGYRVEYASSGRAKCNGRKPCKGTAIGKGEIRFGTWVTVQEHGAFKWRHWGCLTSSVLKNVADELDDKIDELDGFEDLKPEDQDKIKKAFETGSIDLADVPSSAIAETNEKTKDDIENVDEKKSSEAAIPTKRKRASDTRKSKPTDITNDNDENQDQKEQNEKKRKNKKTNKIDEEGNQVIKEKKQASKEKKVKEPKKKKIISETE